jgi:hypothetical protein
MAPRANWKGFLRLSLVTCPVALYPATSESEKISFNQLNRQTGHRIKAADVRSMTVSVSAFVVLSGFSASCAAKGNNLLHKSSEWIKFGDRSSAASNQ